MSNDLSELRRISIAKSGYAGPGLARFSDETSVFEAAIELDRLQDEIELLKRLIAGELS